MMPNWLKKTLLFIKDYIGWNNISAVLITAVLTGIAHWRALFTDWRNYGWLIAAFFIVKWIGQRISESRHARKISNLESRRELQGLIIAIADKEIELEMPYIQTMIESEVRKHLETYKHESPLATSMFENLRKVAEEAAKKRLP